MPLDATLALAHSVYKGTKRFGSLDGWRAMAILGVIWHHTLGTTFALPLTHEGFRGVTLFFVISGFLIVTLLLRSQDSREGFSLAQFWWRRLLRIFPIYYGTLLLYVALVALLDRSDAGREFFQNLPFFGTFTTNWFVSAHDGRTVFFFAWSLAAEEQFYLVWPLVEVLVRSRLIKFSLLGALAVVSQYFMAQYYGRGGDGSLPVRMLYNVPLAIIAGTVMAHLFHNPKTFRVCYALCGRRGSAVAGLVAVIASLLLDQVIGYPGEVLVTLSLALLIGSCVIREDNDLAAALQWRPLVWVGTVSYGMYMLHMLGVNLARKAEGVLHTHSPVIDFVGGVAIALSLASISFLFYERPFLKLKDSFQAGSRGQKSRRAALIAANSSGDTDGKPTSASTW